MKRLSLHGTDLEFFDGDFALLAVEVEDETFPILPRNGEELGIDFDALGFSFTDEVCWERAGFADFAAIAFSVTRACFALDCNQLGH